MMAGIKYWDVMYDYRDIIYVTISLVFPYTHKRTLPSVYDFLHGESLSVWQLSTINPALHSPGGLANLY